MSTGLFNIIIIVIRKYTIISTINLETLPKSKILAKTLCLTPNKLHPSPYNNLVYIRSFSKQYTVYSTEQCIIIK
jgi:hypothetical protein